MQRGQDARTNFIAHPLDKLFPERMAGTAKCHGPAEDYAIGIDRVDQGHDANRQVFGRVHHDLERQRIPRFGGIGNRQGSDLTSVL